MANYYFRDANGKRQGPYNERQIISFITRRLIAPTTLLETDSGYQVTAATVHSSGSDIGFDHFLTPALITIIWWLTVLGTIISLVVLWREIAGNLPQIFIGVGIAVYVLVSSRITLELTAIVFRMERHQRTIKEILERNEKTSKPQS